LRFEQVDTTGDKKEKCLFIHTNITVWSDSMEGRRRVLQVKTGAPKKPYFAMSYVPNPMFEQQVYAKWKESNLSGGARAFHGDVNETVITFNPKELILLEKAFDNSMTARDLKTKADKFTEDDRKACQSVIRRAQNEFVIAGPPRKRRKKADKPKTGESKPEEKKTADAAPAPAPAADAGKKAPASATKRRKSSGSAKADDKKAKEPKKKESKAEDSDDEPISKLKPKADAKSPAKRSSRSSNKTTPKSKTPSDEKKRGRPKGAKNKEREESPKKRSKSKSKK
jgi:hypothetical protein